MKKRLFLILAVLCLFTCCAFGGAAEGSVTFTASNGTEITLAPAARDVFFEQESATVRLLTGKTHLVGFSGLPSNTIVAGSSVPLAFIKSSEEAEKPCVVFTFTANGDEPDAALKEIGDKTVLDFGGQSWPLTTLWAADTCGVFFFDCDFPADRLPSFGTSGDSLIVCFPD